MKKKHLVMPRTPEALKNGVETSKGILMFNDNQPIHVEDDIANEIEAHQGLKGTGDVWTHEDPRLNHFERYNADGIHSYFWGTDIKYANAWEAFEKRRTDK